MTYAKVDSVYHYQWFDNMETLQKWVGILLRNKAPFKVSFHEVTPPNIKFFTL